MSLAGRSTRPLGDKYIHQVKWTLAAAKKMGCLLGTSSQESTDLSCGRWLDNDLSVGRAGVPRSRNRQSDRPERDRGVGRGGLRHTHVLGPDSRIGQMASTPCRIAIRTSSQRLLTPSPCDDESAGRIFPGAAPDRGGPALPGPGFAADRGDARCDTVGHRRHARGRGRGRTARRDRPGSGASSRAGGLHAVVPGM